MSETGKHSDDFQIENVNKGFTSDSLEKLPEFGSPEWALGENQLVRKLDIRILPTLALVFIMNYIDRNGVATARLKGLQQDLHINGSNWKGDFVADFQYATILAIFFVSYCPGQIPSNMILNKVSRPSLYIGICTILWGMTCALTGVTKDYTSIIICRVFIGLPEAAFYPGAIFLLSRWYTKKELALRWAFLYAGILISNAFGGLMAAGILGGMEGKRGITGKVPSMPNNSPPHGEFLIRAWQWQFYIEGAITIFVGFNTMWLLPDYPHNTRWLSSFERRLAQARLSEDAGEADNDTSEDSLLQGFLMAIKDPKVAIFAIMTTAELLGLSFVQFFPTLTQTLGFDTTITLLLTAPPWILASVVCCLNAWHADKTGERFLHITGWWWGVIVGYIIALSTMSLAGRYISLFFMACGYAGTVVSLVWVSNSISRPPTKRAAAIGIVSGCGNLGNLMGSYTWKASWGPKYHQSMAISLGALIFSTVLALVMRQILIRENRKLDTARATPTAIILLQILLRNPLHKPNLLINDGILTAA